MQKISEQYQKLFQIAIAEITLEQFVELKGILLKQVEAIYAEYPIDETVLNDLQGQHKKAHKAYLNAERNLTWYSRALGQIPADDFMRGLQSSQDEKYKIRTDLRVQHEDELKRIARLEKNRDIAFARWAIENDLVNCTQWINSNQIDAYVNDSDNQFHAKKCLEAYCNECPILDENLYRYDLHPKAKADDLLPLPHYIYELFEAIKKEVIENWLSCRFQEGYVIKTMALTQDPDGNALVSFLMVKGIFNG